MKSRVWIDQPNVTSSATKAPLAPASLLCTQYKVFLLKLKGRVLIYFSICMFLKNIFLFVTSLELEEKKNEGN